MTSSHKSTIEWKIVGWRMSNSQFEKCIGNLQHEDMGMAVVVYNKNSFYGTAHSKVFIVVLKPLKASRHGRVFLWLSFFCAGKGKKFQHMRRTQGR